MLPASNDPKGYDTDGDVKQIVEMVEEVLKAFAVDPDRILVSGHSAGGFASLYLVAARPDLFTACAPVSAGTMVPGLDKAKHVPFYFISGKKDFNNKQTTQTVEQMRKAGFEVKFDDPADWDHNPGQEAWNRLFAWFDGLLPAADLASLRSARALLEKKSWGKAGAALRKVSDSKTATAFAKKRAELLSTRVAEEGQKELDAAKEADDGGDTKKAVEILTKAKAAFDGSEIGEKIDAALKEYRKKLEK
jgi:pimeloyl-ACP methyl ester carboxylesterase